MKRRDFLHTVGAAAAGGMLVRAPLGFTKKLDRVGLERSEERRVGKEGRSLCDWSSDVCSSDLETTRLSSHGGSGGCRRHAGARSLGLHEEAGPRGAREIGRASCRERG